MSQVYHQRHRTIVLIVVVIAMASAHHRYCGLLNRGKVAKLYTNAL